MSPAASLSDTLGLGYQFAIRVSPLVVICYVLYQIVLYPRFFSPLRRIPGPPHGNPILGTLPAILRAKPGELHTQWVRDYGPVVRALGPVGTERMMFVQPVALHKILVSDWLEYPRVSNKMFQC